MQSVAWGKLDGTGGRHALTAHSADVAMVFEALVALPEFRRALAAAAGGAVSDAAVRRLVALTFIHDIGKLHPAFQAKARGGSERISHSSAGCGLLGLAAREAAHPLKSLAARLFQRDARMMPYLAAVVAHHGKPVEPSHGAPGLWPGQAWMADAADYQAFFDSAFPDLEPAPLPEAAAFQHLYAGLLALADWIGSDRDFFPFDAEPGADYLATSKARAEHALRQIGLDGQGSVLAHADFGRMTGFSPRAAQAAIAEISPDARLAILEAETGSGKTEAALWHFARLYAAGKVSGLYFAARC